MVEPPVTEPATVIVPAYNESAGIQAAVRSIVASSRPVEVIVVDDGSTDGTPDIVDALGLPGVTVIRKENGGKPSAPNAGSQAASHDLVVMVDDDTVFEPDTVWSGRCLRSRQRAPARAPDGKVRQPARPAGLQPRLG